jgi:hypothetical protein
MILDLNPVTKEKVQQTVKTIANEVKRCNERWEDMAAYLESLTPADLTALGFNETDQAYLGSFKVALRNMVHAYRNEAKEGTDSPSYFIEILADPLVF